MGDFRRSTLYAGQRTGGRLGGNYDPVKPERAFRVSLGYNPERA